MIIRQCNVAVPSPSVGFWADLLTPGMQESGTIKTVDTHSFAENSRFKEGSLCAFSETETK